MRVRGGFLFVRLSLLPFLLLPLLTGCPSNGEPGDGGMDARIRDGGGDAPIRRLPDGRVVVDDDAAAGRETMPCGASRQTCCRGDACDLGLRCESGMCCGRPGGGRCSSAADCCAGFACEGGECRAPVGSDCIGSRECSDGLACLGGTCTMPTDGCGVEGGGCCAGVGGGDPVCRSGSVCSDDGTTCERCGAVGQPCCDGAGGGCGSSTTSLCISGDCVVPDGCGVAGMPCCAGSEDGCVRSAECTDGMCMDRPGAGEPGSGCGGDGEPCCLGGECAFGSICESFLTNMCIGLETISDLLGFACGDEGQICCLPDFTCTGGLECDLLFCSGECTGIGDTCEGSDDCCDSASCIPSPSVATCCKGPEQTCFNDFDCCGWMLCGGRGTAGVGVCECQEMGEQCVDDSECCMDGVCTEGLCRPGPGMCTELGTACEEDTECCGAFACGADMSGETDKKCCAKAGTSCEDEGDCCGGMLCTDNVCVCEGVSADCTIEEGECCEGNICVLGSCAVDNGVCKRLGDTCDQSVAGDCCGSASCRRIGSGASAPFQCCAASGDICESSLDCCGTMLCEDGRCACKMPGESCGSTTDCCGGGLCNAMGVCE